MDTMILRSPFFLDVNFTALVMRFTSTALVSMYFCKFCVVPTLLHPVQIGDDVLYLLFVK